MRIVDGTAYCGRLEVYAFLDWRNVCPSGFEDIDATVACIDMGFGYVCVSATITMTRQQLFNVKPKRNYNNNNNRDIGPAQFFSSPPHE